MVRGVLLTPLIVITSYNKKQSILVTQHTTATESITTGTLLRRVMVPMLCPVALQRETSVPKAGTYQLAVVAPILTSTY